MVFQFLSMSLNFLVNRRGLSDTTTFFPQCNLKPLTIQIVVLVPWLLFVLICLRIILEECAPARGNRPALFFFLSLASRHRRFLAWKDCSHPTFRRCPLCPKQTTERSVHIGTASTICLLLTWSRKTIKCHRHQLSMNSRSKTPADRTYSPWIQE